ncbi:MAG TPA: hypothetical protein VM054_05345 [bacterium]|nr:hypothetical protein [bacterium]
MLHRSLYLLLLASLPVSALTLDLDGLKVDLDEPDGTELYAYQAGHVLLLRPEGEALGVIYIYPVGEPGHSIEEITSFYDGDANAFLGDMLADLRRAITAGDRGPAFRWGGYNRTSAKGVPIASADYFNFGYYNLDSLLLVGKNLVHVDCYCHEDKAEAFREVVLDALATIGEHGGA